MEYKMNDICSNLSIGKSTFYSRLETLKKELPESDWKHNSYFYYNDKNKLFITEKGYDFIKNFKANNNKKQQNSTNTINEVSIYQNQIIEFYKQRVEYLENENKRLLDIISFKEQRDLAKDVKTLRSGETNSSFLKFWDRFRRK